jgi:hypothetical protein
MSRRRQWPGRLFRLADQGRFSHGPTELANALSKSLGLWCTGKSLIVRNIAASRLADLDLQLQPKVNC